MAGENGVNGAGANGATDEPTDGVTDQPVDGGSTPDDGQPAGDGTPGDGQPSDGGEPTPPAEPEHVQELRREIADLRSWREQQEKRFAEDQKPKVPEPPRERTDQDWQGIEKAFGINSSVRKDENGNDVRELSIDSRKLLGGIESMVDNALRSLEEKFESRLHESVSPFRMDPVFADLEKDSKEPLPDIRQFSAAIKEYLKDRYHPRDHSNPKHVRDAYYWAKGRGMKDIVKKIENAQETRRRVIHPVGGSGTTTKKPVTGGGQPTADPAVTTFLQNWK